MKMLTGILLLVSSMLTFASTDVETFFYDGSQASVRMSLNAEQTHIEYRYENQQTICYRQEVWYQTVCRNTPRGRICQTIPHYRTIPYSCIRTVQVPYVVKDYDVVANVNLDIAKSGMGNAAETFKVTLNGDKITLSASGSKRFFIILKKQNVQSHMHGSVKMIDASYSAELVEASPVVNALEMTNIQLRDGMLNFSFGPVAAPELIGYHLVVKKAPILGSDTTLFDRELASSEIQINAEANASVANVDIAKLGIELNSGRHTLTAKAFFKHAGQILNASQFERIEASRTLIYKIR